jgi:hypothetical protein
LVRLPLHLLCRGIRTLVPEEMDAWNSSGPVSDTGQTVGDLGWRQNHLSSLAKGKTAKLVLPSAGNCCKTRERDEILLVRCQWIPFHELFPTVQLLQKILMIKGTKSEIGKNICKLKARLNSYMITGTNLTAPKVITLIDVPWTNKKSFFPHIQCAIFLPIFQVCHRNCSSTGCTSTVLLCTAWGFARPCLSKSSNNSGKTLAKQGLAKVPSLRQGSRRKECRGAKGETLGGA